MSALHILSRDDDTCESITVVLSQVAEIKCKYPKIETKDEDGKADDKDGKKDEKEKKKSKWSSFGEMDITYVNNSGSTSIDTEKNHALFTVFDDSGEIILRSSNLMDVEKTLIKLISLCETESEEEEEEETVDA